jgi:type III restriction enzyme
MTTDSDSATSWVQKTPGVAGGDACIRTTRVTVHGLVEWKQLGLTDEQILASIPNLTPADLRAAWAYYEQHRDEIDQTIRADREA